MEMIGFQVLLGVPAEQGSLDEGAKVVFRRYLKLVQGREVGQRHVV